MKEVFENYKFRCSALGNIVSKSGKMTETTKTYLMDVFIGELYGIRKDINSKYLDKGIACETAGVKMLNNTIYQGRAKFVKNVIEKSNEIIKGTCDVNANEDATITDIKNAFDRFTFGKANLTWGYEWQIKGYCMLFGREKGRLFYCLNDMPDYLVANEVQKAFYQGNFITQESEEFRQVEDNIRSSHIYTNIPIEERFKFWDLALTEKDIETIMQSVTVARMHLVDLYNEHLLMVEKNLNAMGKSLIKTIHNLH